MMLLTVKLNIALLRFHSTQTLPSVIKVPVYVKKHIKKVEKREAVRELALKKRIVYRGNTSIPIIRSTQKEYNFYSGQVYNSKYPLPLQSKYWFKTKSSGQKFTIYPWDANPSLPLSDNDDFVHDPNFPEEFSQMITSGSILVQMHELGFSKPTPIQTLSIPRILEHQHMLLTAETGCGKTVAYLVPILQQILSSKQKMKRYPETPLALVIAPGRELAEQIGKVAYELAKNSDIDVKVLISDGTKYRYLKPYSGSNVDLLVASVGTIQKLFTKGVFKLSNLQHLVLDEADTLLDDTFIENVQYMLRHLPIQSDVSFNNVKCPKTQVIFVSSIYPSNLDSILSESFTFEDLIKVRSPYLHRILPHILQRFWRVNNDTRSGDLLHLVKANYQKKQPVIVFCNKSPTCDWISLFLEENGVPNVKFHGAVHPVERSAAFHDFQVGKTDVLVCTDLASRGLDTQRVKHVINFDFPNNVSDYLLRVGRVGRVGSNQGTVTNLIVAKSGVYTVQEIERSIRQMCVISNVDSNIKRKIKKLYFSP